MSNQTKSEQKKFISNQEIKNPPTQKNIKSQTTTSKKQSNSRQPKSNQNPSSNTAQKKQNQVFISHVWWLDALLFIGGTLLLGGLATLLGGKMFHFEGYTMPPGTVPKIVFPIAWAIIYLAIGVSTFLMWRDKEIASDGRKINLICYFIHMFFNVIWPLFFFRLNLPVVAVIILGIMIATACIVMYRYFVCNLPAGIIFCIYTLWLIYALYLNLGLVLINFI